MAPPTAPPILLGAGGTERVFDHVIEYCDGWMPPLHEGIVENIARLKARAADGGRDPATFGVIEFRARPRSRVGTRGPPVCGYISLTGGVFMNDGRRAVLAGAVGLGLAGLFPAMANAQADLDALVKAAKADGEFTFYSAATENLARRTAQAFTAKYGIKANFVRLSSGPLLQRFSSEADAGNIAADLILNAGNSAAFALEGVKKGWLESVTEANLPVVTSKVFPAQFNRGASAVVQIAPWGIVYNSDKVKGADIPKDYRDLLNPKWKGQILLPDPKSSDAYLDFWAVLMDKYGESFFTQLRALAPRPYPSGVPAVQALGAGEGAFELPAVPGQVSALTDKGAPIKLVTLDHTSAVEMQVMLTARARAKHPAAARLFANYVMSPEGNKVFNDDPGGFTIYDTSSLPKQYEAPKGAPTLARRDALTKALGF